MITKQHSFGSFVIVSVLLGVLVDVSGGMMNIQLIPQNPVIRGSVTLSVTGITGRIQSFFWSKGPNTNREYLILTYIPGDNPIIPGPLYNSRMTPLPDGSLKISNLNMTDEGKYIVKIQTTINQSDTTVYMKIYDVVGKPSITISTSLSKENDSVTLTCTSTNAEWIVWSRVPDGATLSLDNRTLSFKIKRSDSGDYRCETSNPVSKKTSDPITITVAYGPENVKVNAQRSPSNSFISFECSADSIPPATYHWRLNGAELIDNIDQTLSKGPITGIGIGIAVVLLLVLVAVLAYLFAKHRQHKKQPDSTNNALSSPEGPVYENVNAPQSHTSETALSGIPVQATQESHYEQLTHKDRAIYSTLSSKAGKH
ncbi:cell adhesion molecule CEACAM6-like isoform X3 [Aquarana catesbeiana]|uniref:cell adhesion molecule CEACAM6-like isoform X3 n=1 Tax=Aquarana catesbeiana TaxID=8400 RepID=UPI003CC9A566